MDRQEVTLTYLVGDRTVTVKAMDVVAVEDCYEMQMKAVLHRYVTGEDVTPPISREVKDALIKQSLTI
jgi:hypothetical protein